MQVEHSKSQPTDDKPSLKWAWPRHMTRFKFLVPLRYLWNGLREVKGNAKCKNSRYEPTFGGLRGKAQVHLWLWKAHCRLPISDNCNSR